MYAVIFIGHHFQPLLYMRAGCPMFHYWVTLYCMVHALPRVSLIVIPPMVIHTYSSIVMAPIRIISWNVQGLNDKVKRFLVMAYLKKYTPHNCILHDTHLVERKVLS